MSAGQEQPAAAGRGVEGVKEYDSSLCLLLPLSTEFHCCSFTFFLPASCRPPSCPSTPAGDFCGWQWLL